MNLSSSENLTFKQKELLTFIYEYIKKNFFPPSINDIAKHFSINIKTAYERLKALEKKGYIERKEKSSRSINITEKGMFEVRKKKIPIVGTVIAGTPVFSEIDINGELVIDRERFQDGEYFSLKVEGLSMKDIGILEGDYVIVQITNNVKNGDIVVAMIDGEVTIKKIYFKRTNGKIILHPENKQMKDIIVHPDNIRIIGKVVGVQRFYV